MSIKNVKRNELIQDISNSTGFSLNFSKKLLYDLINIFTQNIKTGNFILKNIGVFKIIDKKKRIGRNPQTGEEFIIKARNSVKFKPAKKILSIINTLNE